MRLISASRYGARWIWIWIWISATSPRASSSTLVLSSVIRDSTDILEANPWNKSWTHCRRSIHVLTMHQSGRKQLDYNRSGSLWLLHSIGMEADHRWPNMIPSNSFHFSRCYCSIPKPYNAKPLRGISKSVCGIFFLWLKNLLRVQWYESISRVIRSFHDRFDSPAFKGAGYIEFVAARNKTFNNRG